MELSSLKKTKVAFFGTPEIATHSLQAIVSSGAEVVFVITQTDATDQKTKKTIPPAVKKVAQKLSLTVYQPENLEHGVIQELFAQTQIDVVVLFAYGLIIPNTLLEIPTHGWVNIHPSLLPKYRGASPIQSAILAGEKQTGISIIRMDSGIDTGDILSQEPCTISNTDTTASLSKKIQIQAGKQIVPTLQRYLAKTLVPSPQPVGANMLTKRLTKKDGAIDWMRDANYISRMIRAYTPWPGAYTNYKETRISIKEGSPASVACMNDFAPGTAHKTAHDSVHIRCGNDTCLEIKTLQRAGKKEQSANTFLLGFAEILHARLG